MRTSESNVFLLIGVDLLRQARRPKVAQTRGYKLGQQETGTQAGETRVPIHGEEKRKRTMY